MSCQKKTGIPLTTKKEPPIRETRWTKQKEQFTPSLSSLSMIVVPIDRRKRKDIPAVEYLDEKLLSFNVSKPMARTLRHRSLHRDIDGAMEWNRLLPVLRRYYSEAPRWTNQRWINHLHKGSNKKRFQYYLDSDCFIHYMRAIQDHSVGNQVDP